MKTAQKIKLYTGVDMTKEDTIQILDLIELVLSRCTNELYSDSGGSSTTYVDPDKVRRAISDIKSNLKETV